MERLINFAGLIAMFALCQLCSNNRRRMNWRLIFNDLACNAGSVMAGCFRRPFIGRFADVSPRRRDLAQPGLRALAAGTIASFMTAGIAGMLI
jgi:nucleoside permease NupC